MILRPSDSKPVLPEPHPFTVPAWVRRGPAVTVDPVMTAGAALGSLDAVMKQTPAWFGVWQQRLALRAAASACRRLGRTEDERALRDLWQMRSAEGGIGPSGAVLRACQDLGRIDCLSQVGIARAGRDFGNGDWVANGDLTDEVARATANAAPLAAAAAAAALVMNEGQGTPSAELLALWVADAVLARALGWDRAVPLLSTEMLAPGGAKRRPRPGEPEWSERAAIAATTGAVSAIDLAEEMKRRADSLTRVARQVRAKRAGPVIETLLREDAVTPAHVRGKMSDRAARRLFERLVALGGVRELSGRSTFRIYGL